MRVLTVIGGLAFSAALGCGPAKAPPADPEPAPCRPAQPDACPARPTPGPGVGPCRTLLVFVSDACPNCRRLERDLARVHAPGLNVRVIHCGRQPGEARVWNVTDYPTVIRLDRQGRELSRRVGYSGPLDLP